MSNVNVNSPAFPGFGGVGGGRVDPLDGSHGSFLGLPYNGVAITGWYVFLLLSSVWISFAGRFDVSTTAVDISSAEFVRVVSSEASTPGWAVVVWVLCLMGITIGLMSFLSKLQLTHFALGMFLVFSVFAVSYFTAPDDSSSEVRNSEVVASWLASNEGLTAVDEAPLWDTLESGEPAYFVDVEGNRLEGLFVEDEGKYFFKHLSSGRSN